MIVAMVPLKRAFAQSMWSRQPARLYPMRNRNSRKNVFLHR